MAETSIEWTDYTFNPWLGCTKVSPACDHCYAESWAKRSGLVVWGQGQERRVTSDSYWKQLRKWNAQAEAEGKRKRVFCGSLCDVMENGEMQDTRERLYAEVEACDWLDFLMLTKRPQNFRRFLPNAWLANPRKNVWLMTTVESPAYLWRINELRKTPAVVRGLSIEPLLEDMGQIDLTGIHWAILGGESGPHARPMNPRWARGVRDQCVAASVPFLFKQWGEYCPARLEHVEGAVNHTNGHYHWEVDPTGMGDIRRMGKKSAGRLLDGKEWNEYPKQG